MPRALTSSRTHAQRMFRERVAVVSSFATTQMSQPFFDVHVIELRNVLLKS